MYLFYHTYCQRLTVRSHSTHAYANSVHGYWLFAAAEDLVRLYLPFPLFSTLLIFQLLIDKWQQAACQWVLEVLYGKVATAHRLGHLPVDFQNRRTRIGQFVFDRLVQLTHLGEQLAHVLRTGAAGGLVGHSGYPLHQAGFE